MTPWAEQSFGGRANFCVKPMPVWSFFALAMMVSLWYCTTCIQPTWYEMGHDVEKQEALLVAWSRQAIQEYMFANDVDEQEENYEELLVV